MTSTATIIRIVGNKQPAPGPGSYNIPSCFGKAPQWTIKNKYPSKQGESTGGYEVIPSKVGETSKWSLRSRIQQKDYVGAPGPSYVPPNLGRDAHTSCLHQRPPDPKDTRVSPGPGKYDTRPGTAGPSFTLKARQFPPDEGKIEGPGGGKYLPDYDKVMPSSQKFGIKDRFTERSLAQSPGPGAYDISRDGSKRTSCFHTRHAETSKSITPGPKYDQSSGIGPNAPKYSMRSRIDTPNRPLTAPYQKVPDHFGKEGNKWSFSIRSKDRDYVTSPGPDYVPPRFGSDSRAWSLYSRQEKKRDVTKEPPGPGAYEPKQADLSHKFTMKARQFTPDEGKADGPGGGKYLPDYEKTMVASRKSQIRDRIPVKNNEPNPGYEDLGSTLTSKGITIGRKEPFLLPTVPGIG